EIKSQQVLAPAANVIGPRNVPIKLRRSPREEIVQGIEEILSAVDAGQGSVALSSLIEHAHLQGVASSRNSQVVRYLPDVMSKAPGIALACAILGNPDPAKRDQAQLRTRDKEQVGLHVKQGHTVLVAVGPVKTEAGYVEDSRRKNLCL